MGRARVRPVVRPSARGLLARLAFFVPLMTVATWLIDRRPLDGCFIGVGAALLGWCLDAYRYRRRQ